MMWETGNYLPTSRAGCGHEDVRGRVSNRGDSGESWWKVKSGMWAGGEDRAAG